MKVYVLRVDQEGDQHPVKVYTSVEAAMQDNPGEWSESEWDDGMKLRKKFAHPHPVPHYRLEYYLLEEFEMKE